MKLFQLSPKNAHLAYNIPKTVVLFTERYPFYSVTESTFVTPEMEYLQNEFERIILVPTTDVYHLELFDSRYITDLTYCQIVLAPIRIRTLYQHPICCFKTILAGFKGGYSPFQYKAHLKEEIHFTRFKTWIKRFKIKYNLLDTLTVYYSFWLTQCAVFLGLTARKNKNIHCIARAHRFDIFELTNTLLRKKGVEGLRKIFPCSEDGVIYLKQVYPSIQDKIEVRYLGVEKYENESNPLKVHNKITFLSCHTLIARKRGLLCLDSLITLAKQLPAIKIEWILIGDGPQRQQLQEKVHQCPKNLIIHFYGARANKEVHKIYATMSIDYTILLSESEGLPVAVLESLAYGVPVITCDVGGTREAVQNNENGILLPLDVTPELFCNRVLPILCNRDSWAKMSNCAKTTYNQMFNAKSRRKMFAKELSHFVHLNKKCF